MLEQAGYYDERFFIYGNERDLAARVLGLGYRIKIVPDLKAFHKTPFGMKAGPRSLYFHVRNLWWYLVKNCSVKDMARFFLHHLGILGRTRRGKHLKDSVGIIGLKHTLWRTRWGWWIFFSGHAGRVRGPAVCDQASQGVPGPGFSSPHLLIQHGRCTRPRSRSRSSTVSITCRTSCPPWPNWMRRWPRCS